MYSYSGEHYAPIIMDKFQDVAKDAMDFVCLCETEAQQKVYDALAELACAIGYGSSTEEHEKAVKDALINVVAEAIDKEPIGGYFATNYIEKLAAH